MDKTQIKILVDIGLKSGEIALKYFNLESLEVSRKSDNSEVTKADHEISQFIYQQLKKNFPEICVICEEGQNRDIKSNKFWLIDPIDGTKEFIAKRNEFTVNIALIENNIPIFGLIYAPKISGAPLYYIDENQNLVRYLVEKNEIKIIKNTKIKNPEIKRILSSRRSKNEEIMEYLKNNFPQINLGEITITKASSSFKFCKMIENEADLSLSLKPTMEWDSAAGHALILAAKGRVLNLAKEPLIYRKERFANNGFIVEF